MLKRPSDGFWSGLVVGIMAVTLLMYFHIDVNGSHKAPALVQTVNPTEQAAQQFVDDWKRMAYASWTVNSSFHRVLATGQTYDAMTKDVQSPPDYLHESSTSATGSIGGRLYTCAFVSQSQVSGCVDNGPSPPFDAYEQNNVIAVQQLVLSSDSTYSVTSQDGGCFQLFLEAGKTANTWGNKARFCFDAKTGAPTSTDISSDEGTDTTQAINITDPTPDDLKISVQQN